MTAFVRGLIRKVALVAGGRGLLTFVWAEVLIAVLLVAAIPNVILLHNVQPVATTTLGLTTYHVTEPDALLRIHEAVHRRQFRERPVMGTLMYTLSRAYRLRVEAEAAAAELCSDLWTVVPVEYSHQTLGASSIQGEHYSVFSGRGSTGGNPVDAYFLAGVRCSEIFSGVSLDYPDLQALTRVDSLRVATFLHFRDGERSTPSSIRAWRAQASTTDLATLPPFGSAPQGGYRRVTLDRSPVNLNSRRAR